MGDRQSTFFMYLQADCEGNETECPAVQLGEHMDRELWCIFIDCEDKDGVKWKPKAGKALLWENLDGEGKE